MGSTGDGRSIHAEREENPIHTKDVYKRQVLNSWGKIRSWGCHMVHHALYQKQNYSYAGIIEA